MNGTIAMARPATARPRSWAKTILVAMLLCLVPVSGVSMATMYWVTRDEPDRYDWWAAAGAGGALTVLWLVLILAVSLVGATIIGAS